MHRGKAHGREAGKPARRRGSPIEPITPLHARSRQQRRRPLRTMRHGPSRSSGASSPNEGRWDWAFGHQQEGERRVLPPLCQHLFSAH